jgi:hypothetical protein
MAILHCDVAFNNSILEVLQPTCQVHERAVVRHVSARTSHTYRGEVTLIEDRLNRGLAFLSLTTHISSTYTPVLVLLLFRLF